MKLKPTTAMLIANIVLWSAAIILGLELITHNWSTRPLVRIIGMGLAAIGVLLRFTIVKCPACGDKFMGTQKVPETCPTCGEKLR